MNKEMKLKVKLEISLSRLLIRDKNFQMHSISMCENVIIAAAHLPTRIINFAPAETIEALQVLIKRTRLS